MVRTLPIYLRPVCIRAVIVVAGCVVSLTAGLAAAKLSGHIETEWWNVLLPVAAVLLTAFIAFTIAVLMWVYTALRIFGGMQPDPQLEGGEISLDIFFQTSKICFMGHGYITLLIVAFGLLIAKLHYWPTFPVVYPLFPLIIIGTLYIFVAVMFKRPEVDVGLSFFVGSVILSQCIMLVIKLDHFAKSERLPWAVTFIPSWLAYVIIVVYCGGRAIACVKQVLDARDSLPSGVRKDSDAEIQAPQASQAVNMPGGVGQGGSVSPRTPRDSKKTEKQAYRKLWVLAALAAWAVGFCASQIMLTCRLDSISSNVPWTVVIAPGLVGWLLLVAFASDPVSLSTAKAARLIFDPFGTYRSLPDAEHGEREPPDSTGDGERQPLLPWR